MKHLDPARRKSEKSLLIGSGLALALCAGLAGTWLHGRESAARGAAGTVDSASAAAADPNAIQTIWNPAGEARALHAWSPRELAELRATTSTERDPITGKKMQWKGPLLSQLIEKSLAGLSIEQKAQIDLVVLTNRAGEQALVPGFLIRRYPVLLAYQRDRKPLGNAAPAQLVMPWTSKPRLTQESVPLESFFLGGISRIELTSYRNRYQTLFLANRRDPTALRGETMFMKNCVGCHSSGKAPQLTELSAESRTRKLASGGHPSAIKGIPSLDVREKRALVSYLNAYRVEKVSAEKTVDSAPAVAGGTGSATTAASAGTGSAPTAATAGSGAAIAAPRKVSSETPVISSGQ